MVLCPTNWQESMLVKHKAGGMNHEDQCYFFGFQRSIFSLTLMFSNVGDGSFFWFRLKMLVKPKLSLSREMTTPFGREENSALSYTTP